MSSRVAVRVETVRMGTVARVHDLLCPREHPPAPMRNRSPVPLYAAVASLRQGSPDMTVTEMLALFRECDTW